MDKALRSLDGVKKCELLGIKEKGSVDLNVESGEGVDIRIPIFKVCAENNWPLIGLKNTEFDLEDLFIKLTNRQEEVPASAKKKAKKLQGGKSAGNESIDNLVSGTKMAKKADKSKRN